MLCKSYTIKIITSSLDLDGSTVSHEIPTNEWMKREKCQVLYLRKNQLDGRKLERLFKKSDTVYINSIFSYRFSILPLWKLRRSPGIKIIISPRGMLKDSALKIKRVKKSIFLKLANGLKLYRNVSFLATNMDEKAEIANKINDFKEIIIVPNLPSRNTNGPIPIEKEKGRLNICFIGRVHPIKNLDFLLALMKDIPKGNLELNIYGNEEDQVYLAKCKEIVKSFPGNIKVNFRGSMPFDQVFNTLARHHLLFLPTKGENFGHVIYEALTCGRPVLISDQTPWRNLAEKGIGWDLNLKRSDLYIDALNTLIHMDQTTFNQMCGRSRNFAETYYVNQNYLEKYTEVFSSN